MQDLLRNHFTQSILAKQKTLELQESNLIKSIDLIAKQLNAGHKLLICGNGGSAGDAQHFAAELVGRFEKERPPLAAIALTTDTSAITAISNDYSYEQIFAKQVAALGQKGDVLIAISTSGNSPNVLAAMEIAQQKKLHIIAFTGKDGGKIREFLSQFSAETYIELRAAHHRTAHIQETHLVSLHCLCAGIDQTLFGE